MRWREFIRVACADVLQGFSRIRVVNQQVFAVLGIKFCPPDLHCNAGAQAGCHEINKHARLDGFERGHLVIAKYDVQCPVQGVAGIFQVVSCCDGKVHDQRSVDHVAKVNDPGNSCRLFSADQNISAVEVGMNNL